MVASANAIMLGEDIELGRRILVLMISGLVALACGTFTLGSFVPSTPPIHEHPPTAVAVMTATDTLTEIPLHVGYGVHGPWFDLYFTDPPNPASRQFTGGVDQPLSSAIDAARLSVDAAIYSFTLHNVRDALIRAQRRGLVVRVVMESDNMDGSDPQALKDAGIPLLGDRRQSTMHNKFFVIDRSEVWTGSMNPTVSGAYYQNNNLLRIRSSDVAQDYEAEFNEMFVDDVFGHEASRPTPKPNVTVGGAQLSIYFSPDDHVEPALVQLLDHSRSSIYFLAYSFTADPLGKAIRRRAAAGITVAGVMDADQVKSNVGTEFDAFRAAGLDVRLDGNPDAMHEKVIIIDSQIVVTGSYNFTNSAATSNDENVVVIRDPGIASAYLHEFQRVYELAQP
jgi:phosphatidylserine/phosphatidylglycerophosphate/cardiolipin synthase-like enzyme